MRRLAVFVCSFGYIGFFPIAPGTVGSAAGVAVYLRAAHARDSAPRAPAHRRAVCRRGIALTRPCEEDLRCVDPGPIVIDEVMGMLITLFMIPVGWGGLLLGFLLFRALDVVKPFPARQLERLHGGLGVMADDAMAAVYANLLLRGAYYLCAAMAVMRAEVIAVGSEMLTPTHVDTNSLFITERLNEIGIDLQGKAVAGDDRDALKAIVADALRTKRSADPDRRARPHRRRSDARCRRRPHRPAARVSRRYLRGDRAALCRARPADAGDQPAAGDGAARARSCCRTRTERRPDSGSSTSGNSSCCCRVRRAS